MGGWKLIYFWNSESWCRSRFRSRKRDHPQGASLGGHSGILFLLIKENSEKKDKLGACAYVLLYLTEITYWNRARWEEDEDREARGSAVKSPKQMFACFIELLCEAWTFSSIKILVLFCDLRLFLETLLISVLLYNFLYSAWFLKFCCTAAWCILPSGFFMSPAAPGRKEESGMRIKSDSLRKLSWSPI